MMLINAADYDDDDDDDDDEKNSLDNVKDKWNNLYSVKRQLRQCRKQW